LRARSLASRRSGTAHDLQRLRERAITDRERDGVAARVSDRCGARRPPREERIGAAEPAAASPAASARADETHDGLSQVLLAGGGAALAAALATLLAGARRRRLGWTVAPLARPHFVIAAAAADPATSAPSA